MMSSTLLINRIASSVTHHRLPGLAVVVRQGEREVFAHGHGTLDAAGRKAVTPDSPFGLASLTKFATGSLIMLLHEQHALSLDDPLSDYFPSLGFAPEGTVRLHHLLCHSAGLPGLASRYLASDIALTDDQSGGNANPAAAAAARRMTMPKTGLSTASELAALIRRSKILPLAEPGTLLSYSNEGFCLLGGVIEQVTGQSFAQVLHDRLLSQLGMARSTVGNHALPPGEELALPLIREGKGFRTGRFWQAPLFYPAGGLIGSARDTARLIGSLGDSAALLSREGRERMMQPQLPVPSRPSEAAGYGYALEWHRVDADTTIVWHSGQRTGVSSFMAWMPKQQLAISVLCHLADAPVAAIGHALLGDWLGRTDIVWPPFVADECENVAAPEPTLAGQYGSDEVGILSVVPSAEALQLQLPTGAEPRPLRFASCDSGIVGDQTFRFLRPSPAEPPWAFALDLRVLPRYPAGDQTMSGSSG